MVAVRFLIRKVLQNISGMGREHGVWVVLDLIPRRLRPTRWNTPACFPEPSWPQTQKPPQHGDWEVYIDVISAGYPSVTSEKYMTWCLVRVLLDVSDELHDGTSHEVWFINRVSVTDGGLVFLEGQRHSQVGLIWMFGHRQFLSSFWILEITRFTVSSIRSSLGLLVRGLDFRPHRGLVSGFDWSFFIGFTPVQQSLQEYLVALVIDPIRWILENILKRKSRLKSWFECLEVVISGHTEPTQGTAWPLEFSDFRDISNQRNLPNQ
jgi:general stress protein CsbA